MKKILILYYSRTGNTERMAHAVAEGAKNNDVEVEVSFHVDAGSLESFDAIVVGAPTYHHDIPVDFKNLFEEAAIKGINLKGKVGGTFGSYGWSGEAPVRIYNTMLNIFKMNMVSGPLALKSGKLAGGIQMAQQYGREVADKLAD